MRIWLDLANSPQVLFFRPIVPELERFGHLVTITSRDFAQTTQLADRYGLRHTVVGAHGGKRLSKIGLRVIERAWQLVRFARLRKFDLAVSHNSYAQALAATALRIPFVTSMDYEHQPANHLCFRLASRVIVPVYFPGWALRKYGATPQKTGYYHGLKEQVYLADFTPQPASPQTESLPSCARRGGGGCTIISITRSLNRYSTTWPQAPKCISCSCHASIRNWTAPAHSAVPTCGCRRLHWTDLTCFTMLIS